MNSSFKSDLGIGSPFVPGQETPVKNCWHFFSNGNDVDLMFADDSEFISGMNKIYIVSLKYEIVILAFVLMGTHFHFVLYGPFEQCRAFVHDFNARVSQTIAIKRGEQHKLKGIDISYQQIDTDTYLKNVICYTIKNATAAGLPFLPINYPWSSGPLYFVNKDSWASPRWTKLIDENITIDSLKSSQIRKILSSNSYTGYHARMVGDLVFPGDYVDYRTVEELFKTHKAFHYFLSKSNDVKEEESLISHLSMPLKELRQRRDELIRELFGPVTINKLNMSQRVRVARMLRKSFISSPKQIAKSCCLVYDEVKNLLG